MLLFYLNLLDSPEEKLRVEEIYNRYKKLIKYLAYTKLQDDALAEDVLQEVMLRVINHINKLQNRDMEEIKAFVYLVTRSVMVDLLRKEQIRAAGNIDDLTHTLYAPDRVLEKLEAEPLVTAIARLPDIYRDVLELTAYYGMTPKECAGILHISYAAARKRLARARELLRPILMKGEESYAST